MGKILDNIITDLKKKAWDIKVTGENLFEGGKGSSVILFNVNEIKKTIIIKSIKEAKNTIISRKEELLQNMIDIADDNRIIIKYTLNKDVSEDIINSIKNLDFDIVMKNIMDIDYMIYYPKNMKLPLTTLKNDLKDDLQKYKNTFTDAGNTNFGYDFDLKYENLLSQGIISDRDVYFIDNYINVLKRYYEGENIEYVGAYDDEIKKITEIIDSISKLL